MQIKQDAQWYLAEIVVHITVENDPRSVVHTNMILVQASSDEEAYKKAVQYGKAEEQTYENSDGQRVVSRFRGLHNLSRIYDDLQHGAEIIYSEDIGMDESQIEARVTPKQNLNVFKSSKPTEGPDYSSRDIMREAYEIISTNKNEE